MLATFVLYLREGLEASLIVSILYAALRQLNLQHQTRAIWTGVILAILGSLLGGIALYITIREYNGSTFQTIFETITYIVAVILLTAMTFWMQQHSRTLKKEISARASVAGSGFALGLLAFTSVGREGLESAVFTLAFAFNTNAAMLLLGGVLGVAASVALCVLIYRLGYRLDYRIFFRVMGIILLFFAAGLLGNAVLNMQELGWITFGTTHLWDVSRIAFLSQDTPVGDLLHGLVGYTDAPTVLQAGAYLAFLLIAGSIFARMTRKPTTRRPATPQTLPSDAVTGRA